MKTTLWLLFPFVLLFLLLALFGGREFPDRAEADDGKGEAVAVRLEPILPGEQPPAQPVRPLAAEPMAPPGC